MARVTLQKGMKSLNQILFQGGHGNSHTGSLNTLLPDVSHRYDLRTEELDLSPGIDVAAPAYKDRQIGGEKFPIFFINFGPEQYFQGAFQIFQLEDCH